MAELSQESVKQQPQQEQEEATKERELPEGKATELEEEEFEYPYPIVAYIDLSDIDTDNEEETPSSPIKLATKTADSAAVNPKGKENQPPAAATKAEAHSTTSLNKSKTEQLTSYSSSSQQPGSSSKTVEAVAASRAAALANLQALTRGPTLNPLQAAAKTLVEAFSKYQQVPKEIVQAAQQAIRLANDQREAKAAADRLAARNTAGSQAVAAAEAWRQVGAQQTTAFRTPLLTANQSVRPPAQFPQSFSEVRPTRFATYPAKPPATLHQVRPGPSTNSNPKPARANDKEADELEQVAKAKQAAAVRAAAIATIKAGIKGPALTPLQASAKSIAEAYAKHKNPPKEIVEAAQQVLRQAEAECKAKAEEKHRAAVQAEFIAARKVAESEAAARRRFAAQQIKAVRPAPLTANQSGRPPAQFPQSSSEVRPTRLATHPATKPPATLHQARHQAGFSPRPKLQGGPQQEIRPRIPAPQRAIRLTLSGPYQGVVQTLAAPYQAVHLSQLAVTPAPQQPELALFRQEEVRPTVPVPFAPAHSNAVAGGALGPKLIPAQHQQFMQKQQQEQQQNQVRPNSLLAQQQQQFPRGLMQNEMVSIPAANLNGGLKAASSTGVSSGVSSSVLANAPRVYLTPASSYIANRSNIATGSSSQATATVRYFSQFSKGVTGAPTPIGINVGGGSAALPRKLVNGDTILLSNGNKSLILTPCTSSSGAAAGAEKTNGNNRLVGPKTELADEQHTVIKEELVSSAYAKQQDHPLELVTAVGKSSHAHYPASPSSCAAAVAEQDEPELDIVINNVVCSFSVRCHLKLRDIALRGANVEYRRENGMVTMKLRHPYTTASIWSSGRITCTGATSELMAKVAARRYARCLGKLGFPTRFQNFRIVNVLGTCSMPWAIKIVNFSERHRENASYEPELHPGVTYKMRDPKATLKIFSTGSITVTAASVNDVESAIQHIYPLVHEFRKQRSAEELQHFRQKQRQLTGVDPHEVEEMLVSEAKVQAENDIFMNTTAAHSQAASGSNSSTGLASTSICTVQRLKQFESYRQLINQTQDERRHIPFRGDRVVAATSSSASSSTANAASTGDNICANARRRATERWATKLQNKRPRYNDPGSTATLTAGSTARSATSVQPTAASALAIKTAAIGGVRRPSTGKPLLPIDVVLKQSSSRARNAAAAAATVKQQQREQSFSPSDFHVDDLIEEDDDCV